jgi:PAS domain S-box-containing protein
MKILFVDDNKDYLMLAKLFMEKIYKNLKLVTVDSVIKALELLEQKNYDLIISDYQMPTIDGLDFLKIIRKRLGLEIPFILNTGKFQEDLYAKAMNLGATRCIKKGGEKKHFIYLIELMINLISQNTVVSSLKMYKEKYKYVINTINDGIVSINEKGKITNWNKAGEIIFGYSTGEIIGKPLTQLIPGRFHEIFITRFDFLVKTEKSLVFNKPVYFLGLKKNGKEFPAELSIASWKTKTETFFTAVVREIEQIKKNDFDGKDKQFNLQTIVREQEK